MLDKLLGKLKARGHRVVLFSQFRTMLDIIEDFLILRGFKYRCEELRGGGEVKEDARTVGPMLAR